MLTEQQKQCKHEWNKYIEAVFCGKPLFEYHCALCSLDLEELLKSKYRQGFNEGIDEAKRVIISYENSSGVNLTVPKNWLQNLKRSG